MFQLLMQLRNIVFVGVFVGVFIWLTIYLAKNSEALYKDIIKTIVTFLSGLGVGFGIRSYKKHDD